MYLCDNSTDSLQMDKWNVTACRGYLFLAIIVSIRFVLVVVVCLDLSNLQDNVLCKLNFYELIRKENCKHDKQELSLLWTKQPNVGIY